MNAIGLNLVDHVDRFSGSLLLLEKTDGNTVCNVKNNVLLFGI